MKAHGRTAGACSGDASGLTQKISFYRTRVPFWGLGHGCSYNLASIVVMIKDYKTMFLALLLCQKTSLCSAFLLQDIPISQVLYRLCR